MDNTSGSEQSSEKLHILDYWRIIRVRIATILLVFLLTAITTTVVTFLIPPTYMSLSRIAVEKDTSDIAPDGIQLYRASNHHVNFLDCVKSRKQPSAPGEVAHRSASICHIGAIALELNEGLTWDPVKEEFEGNTTANTLCSRPSRGKWGLESLTS